MARSRDPLPRLNISTPYSMQQPSAFDGRQPMFSPALPVGMPSAHPNNFQAPFQFGHNAMQTPMQPFFAPQPPAAPGRPTHQIHASIAHLAAAGIHPPNGVPITPLSGHFHHPSMMLGPGSGGPVFPNRHRKQLSIGGPPKAALGGPGRKHSPLPAVNVTPAPVPPKMKKVIVNLPKETIQGEDGEVTHSFWARTPLSLQLISAGEIVEPPELITAEAYPSDAWRHELPENVDVFLPGKKSWDDIKRKVIEEKLERLGVERGSGSSMPHIHAPHARAASISSPADPALLFFKLNKLQQSQASSSLNSSSTSPQPPFNLSPSPHQPAPRFVTNRHGHSMSLAQPSTFQQSFYTSTSPGLNPFGPEAVLGSDHIVHRSSPGLSTVPSAPLEGIRAPQGRVPVTVSSLVPPASVSRPDSRPDFTRGFGLDIPEEEEEDENQVAIEPVVEVPQPEVGGTLAEEEVQGLQDMSIVTEDTTENADEERAREEEQDGSITASQSRLHSRHVSRLSAALSLRSVGGIVQDLSRDGPGIGELHINVEETDLDEAVAEWTGSEDLYEVSEDEESIGEWSNPSDEERARQERVDRRSRRRTAQQEHEPRRLPKFPRPPDNTLIPRIHRAPDMISNPSEEENIPEPPLEYLAVDTEFHSRPSSNMSGRSSRPLPPLPHSRAPSQFSSHDPAQAHSRSGSEQFAYPSSHRAQPSVGRETLNPFAKPFVFGAPLGTGSWASTSRAQTPPKAPLLGHTRLPSFGKPLSATAPEFKPGGFNFKLPAGVPTFPEARPLPQPPYEAALLNELATSARESSPVRAKQGREKRQRRGSEASVEEEGDSMQSFRFPSNVDSPLSVRRAAHSSPRIGSRGHSSLNPSAEPFTFSGFSAVMPFANKSTDALPHSLIAHAGSPEATLHDDSTAKPEDGNSQEDGENFNMPANGKAKRAPIPLDFKHPVSSNTVPAGLFKALVNGSDERTRRTVRSRLSSREIFDLRRPSLDDINVPPISRKVSRGRLVTDPGHRDASPEPGDVFGPSVHRRRRSSLPPALHSANSSASGISIPAMDLTSRFEMHQYERRLEELLDNRLERIRQDINKVNPQVQIMVSEVMSMFRAQLRDSAAKGLDESQMDARGELDFELIRDVVQQGHAEDRELIQRELNNVVERLEQSGGLSRDATAYIEQLSNHTVKTVTAAISQLSSRLESMERSSPASDNRLVVSEILAGLTPAISSLRSDAVDYEFLTAQLTQAVKPHISQLIDLASDKRETASLIVDRIMPMLPRPRTPAPPIDTGMITHQLVAEVRRAIAPIDAHEIKEQVADLVVERLDSRLAVRDRTVNNDISGKVTEIVARLLEPVQDVRATLGSLADDQQELYARNNELVSMDNKILALVSDLPGQVTSSINAFVKAQAENAPASRDVQTPEEVAQIKATVDDIASEQRALSQHSTELIALQKDVIDRLNVLPETLSNAANILQAAHAEFALTRDSAKRELDDMRKLNSDYQVQVAKARGAHGQVRVEKDHINEKLGLAEEDRNRLRAQVKELQSTASEKAAEAAAIQARNVELEEALSKALARLQATDVATQVNETRLSELERANRDLMAETQNLKAKVESAQLQANFASRDKDAAVQSLAVLQKQYDNLSAQQSHWDELHRAAEQIGVLTTLIGQADNTELTELRRVRDRSKLLETDHAALQKRARELESRAANSERTAAAARQSLAQAQQRAAEWERRAQEHEGVLERTRTALEQAEQTAAQVDADYALAKLQLDDHAADARLVKDRETKMQQQIEALEARAARLQSELDQARKSVGRPNGVYPAPRRPDSRASTVQWNSRAPSSGRSDTPPSTASVWDSMHAPKSSKAPAAVATRYPPGPVTPRAVRRWDGGRATMPSPTPSVVSLAPTVGPDGWYE